MSSQPKNAEAITESAKNLGSHHGNQPPSPANRLKSQKLYKFLHVKPFKTNTEGWLSFIVNPMKPNCIDWNSEDPLSSWNLFGLNINYNAADVSPILLLQ